jgi:hypothetical protein
MQQDELEHLRSEFVLDMSFLHWIRVRFNRSADYAKAGALVGAGLAVLFVALAAPSISPLLMAGRYFGYAVVGAVGGIATGAFIAALAPPSSNDGLGAPIEVKLRDLNVEKDAPEHAVETRPPSYAKPISDLLTTRTPIGRSK